MIEEFIHWARKDAKPVTNVETCFGTFAMCLVGAAYGSLAFGDGLMVPGALVGGSIFVAGVGKLTGRSERRRREASDIVRSRLKECYQIQLARLEEDE